MNLAKEVSCITPTKAVFASASIIFVMHQDPFSSLQQRLVHSKLTCDQDSLVNKTDYVELGLDCTDVCRALNRGLNERRSDELTSSAA